MNSDESENTRRCELAAEKAALLADNDQHEAAIAQNNVRLTAIRKELVRIYRAENNTPETQSEDAK